MEAIKVKELSKTYKKNNIVAVDHISFQVEEGEIFGLLGLNGAGKTTTVMMLSTLRKPTSGSAKVGGYDIIKEKNQVRNCVGVVFEEQAVDTYLTGRQNLDFYARMYSLPPEERRKRVEEVLKTVGLIEQANNKVKNYSGGMIRRLEIARGMLTNPRILFLDEPTIGVDVQTRRYLWDYVKELNRKQGTTILLTTSYLDEADYLCSRVAVIHKGKLIDLGKPKELKAKVGENLVSLQISKGMREDFIQILQSQDWINTVRRKDGWLELSLKGGESEITDIIRLARDKGLELSSVKLSQPTLNDVILRLVGEKEEKEAEETKNIIEVIDSEKKSNDVTINKEEKVIEVENLTKKFGDFTAVDHISFSVNKGEIFGLLGPNGAGKSTTIKMLITLLHPTSGKAKICGYDLVKDKDKVRSCIGVVFQDRSSDVYLTGKQNLDFHGRMYGLSKEEREKRIKEVLELLDLNGKENIKLNDMPEGMRRRFEVARGFMTYPRVVFLDEPTIGFDIKARMALWNQIKRAKDKEGVAVVLTTHYIEEADYLCDRIAIIDQAKVIAINTPEKLKEAVGTELISLEVSNGRNGDFNKLVSELAWIKGVEEHGNSVLLSVESGEDRIFRLVDWADQHGFQINAIDFHQPTLEDAFLHFTGRTIKEAEGGGKAKKAATGRRN